MAQLTGIQQSISRAWRLLNQTGLMDTSRGLNTEAWQNNVREAVRELREAAGSLVSANNQDAYGAMSASTRATLWRAILAARAPATGAYIISRLGSRYPDMPQHVREMDRELSSRSNGFSVHVLHRVTSAILDAAPTRGTAVEQRAAREGDPMPVPVTPSEGELYSTMVLRAMQRSRSEEISHTNAGDAAMDAFGSNLLNSILPNDFFTIHSWANADQAGARYVDGYMSGRLRGSALEVRYGAQGAGNAGIVVTLLQGLLAGADAHYRAGNPEYRLNYWIRRGCLDASHNDQNAANQLLQRLEDIKRRLNDWIQWMSRHRDHPDAPNDYPTIEAARTASADRTSLSYSGVANCSGPVQGAIRGVSGRGPTGLA